MPVDSHAPLPHGHPLGNSAIAAVDTTCQRVYPVEVAYSLDAGEIDPGLLVHLRSPYLRNDVIRLVLDFQTHMSITDGPLKAMTVLRNSNPINVSAQMSCPITLLVSQRLTGTDGIAAPGQVDIELNASFLDVYGSDLQSVKAPYSGRFLREAHIRTTISVIDQRTALPMCSVQYQRIWNDTMAASALQSLHENPSDQCAQSVVAQSEMFMSGRGLLFTANSERLWACLSRMGMEGW